MQLKARVVCEVATIRRAYTITVRVVHSDGCISSSGHVSKKAASRGAAYISRMVTCTHFGLSCHARILGTTSS